MEDVDVQFENSFCEVVSELTACLSEEPKDLLSKKISCWVREWVGRREEMGASSTIFLELAEEDPLEYKKFMRMSVMQFNHLLSLIEPTISKRDTVMRSAIPARTKLEVALRFLATGDSYQSLGLMFRLPANTISYFMPSVLKAIISALQDYLKVPNTVEEWMKIQRNFEAKWNFPLCVGAIDGKHFAIKRAPAFSGSSYYNYKSYFSIAILAIADSDYKFVYVDIGSLGKDADPTIFEGSTFGKAFHHGTLNIPVTEKISPSINPLPYVLVGD
ncbi:uncharacterized protein LOC128984283 [Macrosteles quadrilineatus]|uniref:uncharacterized protein LOC128984283 n=1 Tax=Macrosteles quadrilineatus TaxID=74068 RepID=UPI0023E1DB6E|nr:uncharacterized protein LOC128984283 [Macrosteles quadrilineatus]